MGSPLSFNHAGLERTCGNCHHPFRGVEDPSCAFPCHSGEEPETDSVIPYWTGVHYTKGRFGAESGCLGCHPAYCHSVTEKQRDIFSGGGTENSVACEPATVENLILPVPLTENTCGSCHPDGCARSTRCVDCHSEHLDSMPLAINRGDEIYPVKFAFPKKLLKIMDNDHVVESVPVVRILPVASVIARGEEFESNLEDLKPVMPPDNCLACHPGVLTRKPPTFEQTTRSIVPRTIFEHNIRGHARYRCKKCHRKSWLVERDPRENIFSMEECGKKCHYIDDCSGCHNFHDPAGKPGDHVDLPLKLELMLENESASETNSPEADVED